MLNRRSFCVGMMAMPGMLSSARGLDFAGQRRLSDPALWTDDREVRFLLNDPLDHPFYRWPRTLLSYPIVFQRSEELERMRLTRVDTGEQVPIQFSEVAYKQGRIHSATLHFFSDLPSGSRREFSLTSSNEHAARVNQVKESREGSTIDLDSGPLRVRIPAAQQVRGDAPGPILQLSRGGQWVGSSTLAIENDRVTQIGATRVAAGPLFVAYELAYDTAGGSRYVARVQLNGGFDFVHLEENMEGLRPGARGMIATTWTGFEVTHRQTPNHPFPVPDGLRPYDDYAWERIDQPWPTRDVRFGSSRPIYPEKLPEGELPVRLGIYQASTASSIGTSATFWDERSGDALGVFIDQASAWQDHQYAYEVEAPKLQVSFHHHEGEFSWKWPVALGRRSTCLTFYGHDKDRQAMRELEEGFQGIERDGIRYRILHNFTSYPMSLQIRYGTLDLNRVKEWELDYPRGGRRPAILFPKPTVDSAADFEHSIMTSNYVCTLPVTGTCEDGGFNPVRARHILDWWIAGFNCLSNAMTERQHARLTAMFLFIAYVHAGDNFMPLVPMLGGHPNFFADVKGALPGMSFLFPDHPMATAWVEQWETGVALVTRYNTRPSVDEWSAHGGRWTENLGTYVWAFLRPSLRADFLLRNYDGVERFATPQLAAMADWLVNALSAPFAGETPEAYRALQTLDYGHEWGALAAGKEPRRVYPPIGAHAEERVPPRSLWYLGTCLKNYAPLAAEHAMWAARPANQDMETPPGGAAPWNDLMYRAPDNRGTNPRLRSGKYTGYGIVLRAAVDSVEEISIHLQQIDEGPNYRWGWAGEGGCGALYFFAAGRALSFNGSEDGGDRKDQDTDFCTNFGVFKDGKFRSIGQNVMSRPLYDLGFGQFAELIPREGPGAYAAPEYISRSVLLAGQDYFVLHDSVLDPSIVHRLSWFVRRGSELPSIQFVRGADPKARETQRTDVETAATHGVWFDGVGDSMAVVSHRGDLHVEAAPYGCRVDAANVQDMVFCNPEPIQFSDGQVSFHGTAGLIRRKYDGFEFALFHGTQIGCAEYRFETDDKELGFGGTIVNGQPPRGVYYAPSASTLVVTVPSSSSKVRAYIDGEALTGDFEAGRLSLNLASGHHQWELTDTLPKPIAPAILRTENRAGGARVFVTPVAAATQYRLELSKDNGSTWSGIGSASKTTLEVSGLAVGVKVHLRAIASNPLHASLPSAEYPLYVSDQPPPPPDGLRIELSAGAARLTWGEVLGVGEYRLHRRPAGKGSFTTMFHGREREFVDRHPGIQPCDAFPGISSDNVAATFEYYVTAVNGNGEGDPSRIADTNPASWRNWDPRPGERFRRTYSSLGDLPAAPRTQPSSYPR